MAERNEQVAIVFGCNGMGGYNLIRHLLQGDYNTRWNKIYAVSKHEDPDLLPKDNRIQHVCCDIHDPKSCCEGIKKLTDITHMFYMAFIKGENSQQSVDLNAKMFENSLKLVDENNKNLQQVILQTGLKYNGAHLGPHRVPCKEDDPRHQGPNFYYNQEDFLQERGKNARWTWNVVRPHDIIGYAGITSNQMNLGQSLAVYAALCKEGNQEFVFPGSKHAWNGRYDLSDVDLVCRFYIWLTVNRHKDGVPNQAFNCVNKNAEFFNWQEMWHKVGDYFGLKVSDKVNTRKLADEIQQRDKQELWKLLVKKFDLQESALEDASTMWFVDWGLQRNWDTFASMDKARAVGFKEEKDFQQSFYKLFDRLIEEKIIPNFKSKHIVE